MTILKCKMCGGDLSVSPDISVAECEYCGSKQTVPSADDEKKIPLFSRANRLRFNCEFDRAYGVYESIVGDFPDEAEAYWGLLLCEYGIEYVDDPLTGKKIPTCHRSSFDSIFENENFNLVMDFADDDSKQIYRAEAKQIEELRKRILAVSSKEEPYDIFICYKETDKNGDRTVDSVIAQDVYDVLVNKGYRVFFSRISLEDKLGVEYEPFIFAALNSAKIMLVFGTKYDHFGAVWVKNEWSRFLKLIAKDKSKYLIPCFRDIDVYDMPPEFKNLQSQDMGKVGAIQDLLRGIEKLLPQKNNTRIVKETVVSTSGNVTTDSLLERVFLFLEDEEWESADEYCEKVLDIEPKCAMAYVGKLLVRFKYASIEVIPTVGNDISESDDYEKVLRFADDELKNKIIEYRCAALYNYAVKCLDNADTENECSQANRIFLKITDYKDSSQKAQVALDKKESIKKALALERNKNIYDAAILSFAKCKCENDYEELAERFDAVEGYADAVDKAAECRKMAKYERDEHVYQNACNMQEEDTLGNLETAIKMFSAIVNFKDSAQRIPQCRKRIEEIAAEEERKQKELKEKLEKRAKEVAQKQKIRKKKIIVISSICIALIALIAIFAVVAIVINSVVIPITH